MLLDLQTKTLQNYTNILKQVKDLLKQKNIFDSVFNAVDNNFDLTLNLYFDSDNNKNTVTKITVINKSFNPVIIVQTKTNNFKMYIDVVNYFDYNIKSMFVPVAKNTVLDVDKNSQLVFNTNNETYSIDSGYSLDYYTKLQIYID